MGVDTPTTPRGWCEPCARVARTSQGGNQRSNSDTYADLAERRCQSQGLLPTQEGPPACQSQGLHPAEEGPAIVVGRMRPDGRSHAVAYGPSSGASHENRARQNRGPIVRRKRRAFRVPVWIVCESWRVQNPENSAARVAVLCGPGRVPVPAPCPLSRTLRFATALASLKDPLTLAT